MTHYTYILECDDKVYIGVRSCDCNPVDDNYWGSSKHLPKDISVRGVKRIVGEHKTRALAVQREIDLHDLFDVAVNPKFFNKAKQTATGFDRTGKTHTVSDDAKLRIAIGHTGKFVTEGTRAKQSANNKGKGNPMYGKHHTIQSLMKMKLTKARLVKEVLL